MVFKCNYHMITTTNPCDVDAKCHDCVIQLPNFSPLNIVELDTPEAFKARMVSL
jgi:hypothetical protein